MCCVVCVIFVGCVFTLYAGTLQYRYLYDPWHNAMQGGVSVASRAYSTSLPVQFIQYVPGTVPGRGRYEESGTVAAPWGS